MRRVAMRCAWAAAMAAIGGIVGYQTHLSAGLEGCSGGAGCWNLMGSVWGFVNGLPVAMLAIPVYVSAFMASLAYLSDGTSEQDKRRIVRFLRLLSGAAGLYALFLLFVAVFALGRWCRVCLWMDLWTGVLFVSARQLRGPRGEVVSGTFAGPWLRHAVALPAVLALALFVDYRGRASDSIATIAVEQARPLNGTLAFGRPTHSNVVVVNPACPACGRGVLALARAHATATDPPPIEIRVLPQDSECSRGLGLPDIDATAPGSCRAAVWLHCTADDPAWGRFLYAVSEHVVARGGDTLSHKKLTELAGRAGIAHTPEACTGDKGPGWTIADAPPQTRDALSANVRTSLSVMPDGSVPRLFVHGSPIAGQSPQALIRAVFGPGT